MKRTALAMLAAAAILVVGGAVMFRGRRSSVASDAAETFPTPLAHLRVPRHATDPDYDPVKAISQGGLTAERAFGAEPVLEQWAESMATRISEAVTRDLRSMVPEAHVEGVECRTAMCKLVVSVPNDEALRATHRSLQLTHMASTLISAPAATPGQAVYYFSFGPGLHNLNDPEAYDKRRRDVLARARQNLRSNDQPLPNR